MFFVLDMSFMFREKNLRVFTLFSFCIPTYINKFIISKKEVKIASASCKAKHEKKMGLAAERTKLRGMETLARAAKMSENKRALRK